LINMEPKQNKEIGPICLKQQYWCKTAPYKYHQIIKIMAACSISDFARHHDYNEFC